MPDDIDAVTGEEQTGSFPEVVVGKCRHEGRIDAQPSERDRDVRLAAAEGRIEGPGGCEPDAIGRREPQHDLPKSDDASSGCCGHFRRLLRAFLASFSPAPRGSNGTALGRRSGHFMHEIASRSAVIRPRSRPEVDGTGCVMVFTVEGVGSAA